MGVAPRIMVELRNTWVTPYTMSLIGGELIGIPQLTHEV